MSEFNGELKAFTEAAIALSLFREKNPEFLKLEENHEVALENLKAKAKKIAAKSGPFEKEHNGVKIRVDQRQADKFANVKSLTKEEIELLNSYMALKIDSANYHDALKFGAFDEIDKKVRVEGHTFAVTIKFLGAK